jgi:hypothetical protein
VRRARPPTRRGQPGTGEVSPWLVLSALQGPQRTARRGRPAVHDRRARSAVRRRRWLASQTHARCERAEQEMSDLVNTPLGDAFRLAAACAHGVRGIYSAGLYLAIAFVFNSLAPKTRPLCQQLCGRDLHGLLLAELHMTLLGRCSQQGAHCGRTRIPSAL